MRGAWAACFVAVSLADPARSQDHDHHTAPPDTSRREAVPRPAAPRGSRPAPKPRSTAEAAPSSHHAHGAAGHAMRGMYGDYPMSREASGTAWQPETSEHEGLHATRGSWRIMAHGAGHLVADHQGGPRGDDKIFSDNMLMGMAVRSAGAGTLGLRLMLSAEPATMGTAGYPLLLQTGETADGETPLIDRQHPHDLFMELAGSYAIARRDRSLFVYAGLPGEPALGPPAFMHRFTGLQIPTAPISHHWLDSSHITFGVLTAGATFERLKLEASAFRGREPDEKRWNIESPKLDSHSFRLSLNPTPGWALQVSHGRLESPEQLEPEVDVDRITVSMMYLRSRPRGRWGVTFAWGRNHERPGQRSDAFLAEGAAQLGAAHTLFGRAEHAEKHGLFLEPDPRAEESFPVAALSAGYRFDFLRAPRVVAGLGGLVTSSRVPDELRDVYGRAPTSTLVFARIALR